MAAIILANGAVYRGGDLPPGPRTITRKMVHQEFLLDALAKMRADWSTATGSNLESVTVNLELLFDDLESLITGQEAGKHETPSRIF